MNKNAEKVKAQQLKPPCNIKCKLKGDTSCPVRRDPMKSTAWGGVLRLSAGYQKKQNCIQVNVNQKEEFHMLENLYVLQRMIEVLESIEVWLKPKMPKYVCDLSSGFQSTENMSKIQFTKNP